MTFLWPRTFMFHECIGERYPKVATFEALKHLLHGALIINLNLTLALKEQLEFSRYEGEQLPAPNCLTQDLSCRKGQSSGPQRQPES